jgi:hypothetical protein
MVEKISFAQWVDWRNWAIEVIGWALLTLCLFKVGYENPKEIGEWVFSVKITQIPKRKLPTR